MLFHICELINQFKIMKRNKLFKLLSVTLVGTFIVFTSCVEDGIDGQDGTNGLDGQDGVNGQDGMDVAYFTTEAKISLGDGVPEIPAYDAATKIVFSTNSEAKEVDVINISDLNNPEIKNPIDVTLYGGNVNSVACRNGLLAIAIEANESTDNGKVIVFETNNLTTPYAEIIAGAVALAFLRGGTGSDGNYQSTLLSCCICHDFLHFLNISLVFSFCLSSSASFLISWAFWSCLAAC